MEFQLKAKDCPFCGGTGKREDSLLDEDIKCDHSFNKIDYSSLLTTIEDTKRLLKEQRQIAKKMKKVMEATKNAIC